MVGLNHIREAYLEVYEGKVPWNDPDHPLQSGHTPAEKNRAKRARTGVENPNSRNISDKNMVRYGRMKDTDDTETSKAPKQKKTLLGKKKPLEHETPPHQFKKERHIEHDKEGNPRNIHHDTFRRATHTKGQGRRVIGDKEDSATAQAPIRADDTRRRTSKKWGGPNPKKESYEEIYNHLEEKMDPEERALRRAEIADKKASRMDSKVASKYASSEAQSAARADKKSKGKHIHGTVDEAKDSSYLETDMKKRQKNNEKAVKAMKKTKGYADMVKAARKHFDEETLAERELDPTEKGEKERLVKGLKKSAADFKARYGKRAKSVMYATATKMAKDRMDTSKSDRRYGVEG